MSIHEGDGKKNFECYVCRYHFREMIGLRVHLGKVHKKYSRKKELRKNEKMKMECESKEQKVSSSPLNVRAKLE